MERTKKMTKTLTYKPFQMEVPAPGQCLADAQATWKRMTTLDKMRLAEILGIDQVLNIERLNHRYGC